MLEDALDDLPGEGGRLLGQSRSECTALPGLFGVGAVEVDLEERLQGQTSRGVTAAARRPRGAGAHAAFRVGISAITSTSRVSTARSATSIARRIMFARARPWVTTETPATPSSGAETYGS